MIALPRFVEIRKHGSSIVVRAVYASGNHADAFVSTPGAAISYCARHYPQVEIRRLDEGQGSMSLGI